MRRFIWLALVPLVGCSGDETGPAGNPRRAAMVPAAGGPSRGAEPTDWKEGLPAGPVRAKVGDQVLVVRPVFDRGGKLELATVESIAGETATLAGKYGKEFTDVRSALIHPAASFASPKPFEVGQIVFSVGGLLSGFSRVSKVDGDRVTVQGMFMEDVREDRPDFVLPLPKPGTLLLRRVRFENPRHGTRMGLCLAMSDKWAWIRDEVGDMHRFERSEVSEVPDPARGVAVGDSVEVYTIDGFGKGKVVEVLNDGLRYKVSVATRKEPVVVGFAEVLGKP